MADQITGDTEAAAVKMTLIAAMVQRELAAAAKLLPTFMDVSSFAEPGLDKISFPKSTSFSVEKKLSGQKASAQALTYSVDTLNLDQEAVVQWIIEKKQTWQSRVNLEIDAAGRAASAHGRQVDSDLFAAINAGRKIKVENWPETDLTLAIHPTEEQGMLDIANFINADQYGSREALIQGEIGRVFGVRVVVSNLLTENESFMYHRDACAIGFQRSPEFDSDKDLENLGTRFSLDQLYGIKVLQSGSGIVKLA
jgi:hypothetical protein